MFPPTHYLNQDPRSNKLVSASVSKRYSIHSPVGVRTDCVTIFLNVVARGGTVRWNRYITSDLCLATSWLHDSMEAEWLLMMLLRYMYHTLAVY
jgi:hypothetical protein